MKNRSSSLQRLPLWPLAALLIWAGCQSNAQPTPTENRIPVRLAEVVQEKRALPIRASGRLASKAQVDLSFKIGGYVEAVLVEEGSFVRKGQLLARLNQAEIDGQFVQAKAAYDKAFRDHQRIKNLHADRVATLEQLEHSQTALEAAQAALDIVAYNRQHAEITAPAAGKILRRYVEANELVTAGKKVYQLAAEAEGFVVRVGLADRDVVRLARGSRADITFDAYPTRSFTGTIIEIAEAADPISSTFEVEVQVKATDVALKSGFFANVNLFPSEEEAFYLVPIEAVQEGNGTQGVVYTTDPTTGRAQKRAVEIAHLLGEKVAIRSGLEEVTAVVAAGAPYLSDGSLVEIVSQ